MIVRMFPVTETCEFVEGSYICAILKPICRSISSPPIWNMARNSCMINPIAYPIANSLSMAISRSMVV